MLHVAYAWRGQGVYVINMLLARHISMQVSCNYRCKTHIILVRADNKLTAH